MTRLTLILAIMALLPGCKKQGASGSDEKVLNLYIWSEYMPAPVLEAFTQRTGIKVNVDNYATNEELQSKLASGVADYDLCVPTDYMIRILIHEKLIQPLDKSKLPNLSHIDARFLGKSFDPENSHSAPYLWGTTGFGYNKQEIPGAVDSWQALFDEKYANRVLMLNDSRECFAAALKLMGKSLNSADEPTLRAAAEMLRKQKVKTYDSDDFDNALAGGEVVIAQGYNGQFAKLAARETAKFAYVIPKEGCTTSQDALCIPTKARHAEAAHLFINFIHEPEINAQIVNAVNYASTNAGAKAFIRPEILSNPAIYPTPEMLRNCELMEDLGAATELLDQLWTQVKAR